jgi:hypothetical protein
VPQSREIFTCDSLNDKSAALCFASKAGSGHAAAWERDLRRFSESKRRVVVNFFLRHSLKVLYLDAPQFRSARRLLDHLAD